MSMALDLLLRRPQTQLSQQEQGVSPWQRRTTQHRLPLSRSKAGLQNWWLPRALSPDTSAAAAAGLKTLSRILPRTPTSSGMISHPAWIERHTREEKTAGTSNQPPCTIKLACRWSNRPKKRPADVIATIAVTVVPARMPVVAAATVSVAVTVSTAAAAAAIWTHAGTKRYFHML